MNHFQPLESSLQRQQEEFDVAHDLSRLGASGRDQFGIDLGMAQFAVLGLCGECGEVANALKKVLRAAAFNRDSREAMQQLRTELADVFAYLLKAASVLNVDLEEEFLRTVALNCLRFALAPKSLPVRLIGVAGSRVTVDVAALADVVQRNTGNPAVVIDLPGLAAEDVDSVVKWLRDAKTVVSGELDQKVSGGYVIVANDPAYIVETFLNARHDLPSQDRRTLANEWLAFERATWHYVSVRRLFLSCATPGGSAQDALCQHGARVLTTDGDLWKQLQSIVVS